LTTIGIKSKNDFMNEVERDWLAIDRGEPVLKPVTRIYFESAEALARKKIMKNMGYDEENIKQLT
jgi:hypothetical protein